VRLLFVCTGNTCRSPLAEHLARQLAAARGLDWLAVESTGTSAWDGAPASDGSLLVGVERGLALEAHRARSLTRPLIDGADLVLTMGPHHLDRVQALGGDGKSWVLTDYAAGQPTGQAVADPIGGDLGVYRQTADDLTELIGRSLDRLAATRGGTPGASP